MAGTGRKVKFHGSWDKKEDAVKKEQATPGAYVREADTPHGKRFLVLTRRDKQ